MPCKPVSPPPRRSKQRYVAGKAPGLLVRGNIDLYTRPSVANPHGGYSSVDSGTFGLTDNEQGRTIVLPWVIRPKGKWIVARNAQQVIAEYKRTHQHLGIFDTLRHAEQYSQALHLQQARVYCYRDVKRK